MGTPNQADYPGLIEFPNWKPDEFEKYPGEALSKICPKLDEKGLDLLSKLLKINPT